MMGGRALLRLALGVVATGLLAACAPTDERSAPASMPSASQANTPAPPERPNIVFVFADDLGIGDVGAYGGDTIATPHIDALATRGVKLSQGYVSHPVCSPSRAGILGGVYQQRHGWEFNPARRDVEAGMSLDVATFADMLRVAGYSTGMVGKWHLGFQDGYHPRARGFDSFFGVLAGGSMFIEPDVPGVETITGLVRARTPEFGVYRDRELVEVDAYLTDVFTRQAVAFIEARTSPFMLYLAHTAPHTPLQATAEYLDRYRHIEDKATRIYAAMVASVDDSVAAVVAALERTGRLENTLIVFASDNGCARYIGDACSNAPHAGFKRYFHEGGVRVPFIVSWPAALPIGAVYEHPVSSLDLWATFASVAGSDASTVDSVDLIPFLAGEIEAAPHEYLYWRAGANMAIRDERWKLIRYNRSPLTADDLRADGRLAPPAGGWPATSPHGQLTMLYDLDADPGETTNLAGQHPDIVARLIEAYATWHAQMAKEPTLTALRSTLAEVHGETVQLVF